MRVQKDWGFEDIIENNPLYCLKKITCEDGKWSSGGKYHYHPIKDETFYVIEGTLEITVEVEVGLMAWHIYEGEFYRIKPGVKHRFKSYGKKCVFIEASTHDDPKDTVRTEYIVEDKVWRWVDEP